MLIRTRLPDLHISDKAEALGILKVGFDRLPMVMLTQWLLVLSAVLAVTFAADLVPVLRVEFGLLGGVDGGPRAAVDYFANAPVSMVFLLGTALFSLVMWSVGTAYTAFIPLKMLRCWGRLLLRRGFISKRGAYLPLSALKKDVTDVQHQLMFAGGAAGYIAVFVLLSTTSVVLALTVYAYGAWADRVAYAAKDELERATGVADAQWAALDVLAERSAKQKGKTR